LGVGRNRIWLYANRVIGFLRFVGLMNAAAWFGAGVFFTFGAGPSLFSQDMKHLLGENQYPYFSGAIAQVVIARYFHLQVICAIVALLHALAEWFYLGRPLRKFGLGLLLGLLVLSSVGGCVMQPRIKGLHATKYALNSTPEVRQSAAKSLRAWHGMAQIVNLLMLGASSLYLWRVARPADTARFIKPLKFHS
jgi:hypothetical protein